MFTKRHARTTAAAAFPRWKLDAAKRPSTEGRRARRRSHRGLSHGDGSEQTAAQHSGRGSHTREETTHVGARSALLRDLLNTGKTPVRSENSGRRLGRGGRRRGGGVLRGLRGSWCCFAIHAGCRGHRSVFAQRRSALKTVCPFCVGITTQRKSENECGHTTSIAFPLFEGLSGTGRMGIPPRHRASAATSPSRRSRPRTPVPEQPSEPPHPPSAASPAPCFPAR